MGGKEEREGGGGDECMGRKGEFLVGAGSEAELQTLPLGTLATRKLLLGVPAINGNGLVTRITWRLKCFPQGYSKLIGEMN